MEIERKFLLNQRVQQIILSNKLLPRQLTQYYVKVGDVEERFRRQDNLYFHTIKKQVDGGLQREEIETECTRDEFEENKHHIIGNIIEKDRYALPYGGYKIEIDIYRGALEGLIIGEVEFPTKEEADTFILPDFFRIEVTWDKKYKNQNLALQGLPTGI